jgi:hypothetical protein
LVDDGVCGDEWTRISIAVAKAVSGGELASQRIICPINQREAGVAVGAVARSADPRFGADFYRYETGIWWAQGDCDRACYGLGGS